MNAIVEPKPKPKIEDKPLELVIEENMKNYGKLTIEERAIPDINDGLKPVFRRLIWAAYQDGMMPNKGFRKSAEVVGTTMGHYHPHGDQSISNALATLVNMPTGLFEGQGNWGSIFGDKPAAIRYTECRLSEIAANLLLDSRYLKVTPMIPNYSGTKQIAVTLPAKLPMVLVTGAMGIAMGLTTSFPTFTFKSVEKLVNRMFKRYAEKGTITEPTTRDLAATLEFECAGGGVVSSSDEEIIEFFEKGAGRLEWMCTYDVDEKRKVVTITGMPPQWPFEARQLKIADLPDVVRVTNLSSVDVKIEIGFKPSLSAVTFEAAVERLKKELTSAVTYRLNVIERKPITKDGLADVEVELLSVNIATIIARWAAWRVDLEVRAANHEASELDLDLEHERALLAAVDNLDVLFAIMKSREINDKPAAIAKKLNISEEMAKWLWSLALSRFDRLNADAIEEKIKKLQAAYKAAKRDAARPIEAVARRLGVLAA